MHYITRERATNGDRDAVLVRNYPSEVTEARDYDELRDRLEEYAEQQEAEELQRPRRGGGETRTHYKAILSFEREIDTEQALEMADEYLDREFPDARAIAVVHQDTDNTHVHVHIQASDVHDEKLHSTGTATSTWIRRGQKSTTARSVVKPKERNLSWNVSSISRTTGTPMAATKREIEMTNEKLLMENRRLLEVNERLTTALEHLTERTRKLETRYTRLKTLLIDWMNGRLPS
jgi:predicted nuclease with TOPRIM domain